MFLRHTDFAPHPSLSDLVHGRTHHLGDDSCWWLKQREAIQPVASSVALICDEFGDETSSLRLEVGRSHDREVTALGECQPKHRFPVLPNVVE